MDSTAQPGSVDAPSVYGHTPVLLVPVLETLNPRPDLTYVDGTLGAGGHTEAILDVLMSQETSSSTEVRLFGVDQDPVALGIAGERLARFGYQFQALAGNFSQLASLLPAQALPLTGGLLVDLGVSSMQLDTAGRGFSFSKDAPLDMRMSPDTPLTAADIVNTYSEADLRRICFDYGEERLSGPIVRAILRRRAEQPFETTRELAQLVYDQYAGRGGIQGGKSGKIHPATRVFQALRIEVNDELNHLKRLLESLPALIAPGARVAIISFHSLEDRLVKQFFKQASRDCICPPGFPVCRCEQKPSFKRLSTKAITATEEEIAANPRARSAKLRTAIRLA
jgi:16S rRNA (cytosine1402-N4)-methyltransferase